MRALKMDKYKYVFFGCAVFIINCLVFYVSVINEQSDAIKRQVIETEKQVANHLSNHLKQIDKSDKKTIKIIEAMRDDEEEHANSALKMGAKNLPRPMKKIMGYASKVMTKTTFYI